MKASSGVTLHHHVPNDDLIPNITTPLSTTLLVSFSWETLWASSSGALHHTIYMHVLVYHVPEMVERL